mmetsp:Transcript_91075/g.257314  ORF Transcript_91075/g.257314 Transcript_91075/m.257314 type:complete len:206 (+) Transcript_91075:88-705(+)
MMRVACTKDTAHAIHSVAHTPRSCPLREQLTLNTERHPLRMLSTAQKIVHAACTRNTALGCTIRWHAASDSAAALTHLLTYPALGCYTLPAGETTGWPTTTPGAPAPGDGAPLRCVYRHQSHAPATKTSVAAGMPMPRPRPSANALDWAGSAVVSTALSLGGSVVVSSTPSSSLSSSVPSSVPSPSSSYTTLSICSGHSESWVWT